MKPVISTPLAVPSCVFPVEITPGICKVVDRAFDDVDNHKTTLCLLQLEQPWLAAYVAAKFVAVRDGLTWQSFSHAELLIVLHDEIERESRGDYSEKESSSETEDVR